MNVNNPKSFVKISAAVIGLSALCIAGSVQAAHEIPAGRMPQTAPLQPLPAGIAPNQENNIQDAGPADIVNSIDQSSTAQPIQGEDSATQGNTSQDVQIQKAKKAGYSLAALIALFSLILICLALYLRSKKNRKEM